MTAEVTALKCSSRAAASILRGSSRFYLKNIILLVFFSSLAFRIQSLL
jgi:hypothetical protein